MRVETVQLGDQESRFVQQGIDTGRYKDAGQMISAGLRLLEIQQRQESEKLKVLGQLARESFSQIDRGECAIVESDKIDVFMDSVDAISRRAKSR